MIGFKIMMDPDILKGGENGDFMSMRKVRQDL